MKNYRLARIATHDAYFTVRFSAVADYYGHKTIGSFEDMLRKMKHLNSRLCYHSGSIRVYRLLKEIEQFQREYPTSKELFTISED